MAKAKAKKVVIDMNIFCSAKEALETEKSKTVLSVSPALDYRLGGGISEGSFILIQGKSGCGKSLTAMEIAVNALKQGRHVFYFDFENRMTASKYFIIDGFDLLSHPKFFLMNSESNKNGEVISGDKAYGQIIQMMKSPKYRGSAYIGDSLSDVITQDVLDDPLVTAQRRDSTPKLNADFCKKVGPFLRASGSIFVGIQHLQQDISPTGHGALKPVGGDRLNYRADLVLISKHSPLNLNGDNISAGFEKGGETIDGLLIRYDLTKNKLLAPYVAKEKEEKIQNYYKFGTGCWRSREILDVLLEMGLVACGKSGGWMQFMLEKYSDKIQGAEKAAEFIEGDMEYFESIIKQYYIDNYEINYDFSPPEEEE